MTARWRRAQRGEIGRIESGAACERVRQLGAVDRPHRADCRRRAGGLFGKQQPRHRNTAQHADDAADEDQVNERKSVRFSNVHYASWSNCRARTHSLTGDPL